MFLSLYGGIAYSAEAGRLIRSKAATLSDRSYAGPLIFYESFMGRQVSVFLHRSSFELNSVTIMNQPIHNRIGNRRISDMVMPMINRELAGD